MARRRANSNWGKREAAGPVVVFPTLFEVTVEEFGLTPDKYVQSARLREWALSNKNSKYVPEALLEAWSLQVDSSF